MPSTFSGINEVREGAVPQFQQAHPVADSTAEAVRSVGGLATGLFTAATKLQEDKKEAQGVSAIGDLQNQALRIKQAGLTDSSIDVVGQQRLLASNFASQHPTPGRFSHRAPRRAAPHADAGRVTRAAAATVGPDRRHCGRGGCGRRHPHRLLRACVAARRRATLAPPVHG